VATTDDAEIALAAAMLRSELEALDRACSRFRPDSEISRLERSGGRWVTVSGLLFEALSVALDVAEQTGGAVDPTVGEALEALGYDRDFAAVERSGPPLAERPNPATGWWSIELDQARQTVRVPEGIVVDLGSSAKAFAADRAAASIARATGAGTLVSLGGDVSVAGPPPAGGWPVGIALNADSAITDVQQVVCLSSGGLATSSTVSRSWRRGGRTLHHIVDPFTGDVASDCWRLVSIAAPTCVAANAASTAAVVWGEEAIQRLEAAAMTARLVARDGSVLTLGAWPSAAGDAERLGSSSVGERCASHATTLVPEA
jgi:thiamine biosynthesis lipoprotein